MGRKPRPTHNYLLFSNQEAFRLETVERGCSGLSLAARPFCRGLDVSRAGNSLVSNYRLYYRARVAATSSSPLFHQGRVSNRLSDVEGKREMKRDVLEMKRDKQG